MIFVYLFFFTTVQMQVFQGSEDDAGTVCVVPPPPSSNYEGLSNYCTARNFGEVLIWRLGKFDKCRQIINSPFQNIAWAPMVPRI